MTTYTVQWNYASSYGGPWREGEVVELDEAVATAVNRDSPGVVVPKKPKPKPEAKPRAKNAPTKTRQVTKAKADR